MSQGIPIKFDYNELHQLYCVEHLSGMVIAKILGVGWYSVYQALHQFDIPVRKKGSSCRISRTPHTEGYIRIRIFPDDMYFPMAEADGYCLEHRLVMAKHLGRCIASDEVVHHIDRDGTNNNIDNLILMSKHEHDSMGKGTNHVLKGGK